MKCKKGKIIKKYRSEKKEIFSDIVLQEIKRKKVNDDGSQPNNTQAVIEVIDLTDSI